MLASDQMIYRLVTAAVLGAAVGLERERLEWAAGLRTHMLVCLGSALVMMVSMFGFEDVVRHEGIVLDPSRVAAQVVSGIGFLGAGTILFLRDKVIRGLTTAASLWTVAGIGLAAGGGLYVAAVGATAIALVILALVKPLENRLFRRASSRRVVVTMERGSVPLAQIETLIEATGAEVLQVAVKRGAGSGKEGKHDVVQFDLARGVGKPRLLPIVEQLRAIDGVREVRV